MTLLWFFSFKEEASNQSVLREVGQSNGEAGRSGDFEKLKHF